MVQTGYWVFATATLVTHGAIAGLLLVYVLAKRNATFRLYYRQIVSQAPNLVFLATFTALLGSFFFSEIAQFAPCVLCWWQRIGIYPQVVLSYIGIMRNESVLLRPYLIALNVGGLAVSLYHNFILLVPRYGAMLNCSSKGGQSCIEGYLFYYGYISIPLMALTVIVWNLILLLMYHPVRGNNTFRK